MFRETSGDDFHNPDDQHEEESHRGHRSNSDEAKPRVGEEKDCTFAKRPNDHGYSGQGGKQHGDQRESVPKKHENPDDHQDTVHR